MKFLFFLVFAIALFLNLSTEDGVKAQVEYCELVELYESQDNIEYHKRDGHPNYNGINCDRVMGSEKQAMENEIF